MQSRVYLTEVKDYIPELLEEKIEQGFRLIAGVKELVSGKRVFVKINQLANRPPEDAVTTHPLVVEKVVRKLVEYGAKVTIGDDIDGRKKDGFAITGMEDVARKLGVELMNLRTMPYEKIYKNENRFLKELYIAKPVLEADCIVNIAKLKTHSQTTLTLCIKNLYGIIPLGERTRLHAAFSKIEEFSEILVDIYNIRPPSLNILDGILAMEGEGPAAGSPRKLGFFLISRDAVALDSVASSLIGLGHGEVRHIAIACSRSLGACDLKSIDIVGSDPERLKIRDFKFPKVMWQAFVPRSVYNMVYKLIYLRPEVINRECRLCGKCVERCPVKAMEIKKGQVVIDYKICIGCLCCQEICDRTAVKTTRPFAGEILMKGLRFAQKIKSRKERG